MSDKALSLSVTEVRNALRCPRLFTLGRVRGRVVGFPIGSSSLGATFHRVVEKMAREVDKPPEHFDALLSGCARDAIEASLIRWLLARLVDELDSDPTYAAIPGEVDELAEALRELARHLGGRLKRLREAPGDALRAVLRSGERSVETRLEPNGPLLVGKLDALYADGAGSLEVVEYKLTDEANDALDRAQVALYRELLRASEGKSARPLILRFSPTLRETSMSESDADLLVERSLRPLLRSMVEWLEHPEAAPATERRDLCPACPLALACSEFYQGSIAPRDHPPAAATRPRPTVDGVLQNSPSIDRSSTYPVDAAGRDQAERLRDMILKELNRQGIQATSPRPPTVGPTLYVIEIARPRGSVRQLDAAAEDVRHRLASDENIDVHYEKRGGHRRFVVRRSDPQAVLLGPLMEKKRDWLAARSGRFLLGQEPDGGIVVGDFADASTPHLLVAGQAGSGKSCLLRAIVASLVQFHGPESIRFTLLDPKRVTFQTPSFQSAVGAHLDSPIEFDAERAMPAVQELVEIMKERYVLFERARVTDLDEYNAEAAASARLERRVLVIDEFQDLTADKKTASMFFDGIKRLGARARAAGVHLVLATQRPDAATVPPILKANLGGKVAMKVASQTNSRIVLDEGGAEHLLGKGDLLADLGHGIVRAQAAIVEG